MPNSLKCKIKHLRHNGTLTERECDRILNALEQQPCEDCISREAVDEYITNLLSGYLYDEERTRLEDLSAFVWELPSVQPTRPTGKWIRDTITDLYHCSECRTIYHQDVKTMDNFCPNCGARMAESEGKE